MFKGRPQVVLVVGMRQESNIASRDCQLKSLGLGLGCLRGRGLLLLLGMKGQALLPKLSP